MDSCRTMSLEAFKDAHSICSHTAKTHKTHLRTIAKNRKETHLETLDENTSVDYCRCAVKGITAMVEKANFHNCQSSQIKNEIMTLKQ